MTQDTTSSLYIINPQFGPASDRTHLGERADGIFNAIKDALVPTDKRLLMPSGKEREGSYFTATRLVQVSGNGETHFIREGEIVVYKVHGNTH
ncbi:hypothetical protein PQR33_36135 [Paraburkholderia sediminicola]|uniref:hypothetical protein n=1 Tax=Paraburkholderia sediminicola TaxID=458836 RepID=UPI0038BCE7D5